MSGVGSPFTPVCLSLADIAGKEYVQSVCEARAFLTGERAADLMSLGGEPLEWFPNSLHERLLRLLPSVGRQVVSGLNVSAAGCSSLAFSQASQTWAAPLSGLGYYRVGEQGMLHLITKSEHYHAPLGHSFPGYGLIDRARAIGIPNATHNNTRGHLTRLAENELVRVANGVPGPAEAGDRPEKHIPGLSRVLNLQTGSLAAETALKLALARFYGANTPDGAAPDAGCTPVFIVVGDDDGGLGGNYHGTTVTAQLLRGLWPAYREAQAAAKALEIRAVRPNNREDLETVFRECSTGSRRIAAFVHEIIMMNYGARCLSRDFLQRAYALCDEHDAVKIVDEIQSCVWARGLFAFREWGLSPSVAVVGKGFPGGEYAGSRVLLCDDLDTLPQFGALVTNGQEELTSLAYLVTMRWVEANQAPILAIGEYFETRLRELAGKHSRTIHGIEGCRHLAGIAFRDLSSARHLTEALSAAGIDISVQNYKADCPPVALLKLPLIAGYEVVDFLFDRLCQALSEV